MNKPMTNSQPIYEVNESVHTKEFILKMDSSDVHLSKLLKYIAKDAQDGPTFYLRSTLVPEGGE